MRILNTRLLLTATTAFIAIPALAGDALDKWHFRDARVVNRVRFVGGMFIGVGNNGLILTSTDGLMWTARNSETTANLRGVAYGGLLPNPSLYVAVGANSTIVVSSNTIDWMSVPTTNSCDLNDVSYGGNHFVAVTTRTTMSQPNAMRSQNGTSWTNVFFPNGEPIFGSFHANPVLNFGNTFVTAGSPGIVNDIWRSSDGGQTWINQTNSRQSTQGIAYGNGRFVAVGYANSGSVAVSTNLPTFTNWFFPPVTNVCDAGGPGSCMFGNDLAFANGTFVCVRGFITNGILISTNGENWTIRSALAGLNIGSITFGNGTFVVAGPNGIYQSEPVSTPGLSLVKHASSNTLNITLSGQIGLGYRLQTSTNLSNWFDRFSFTNTSPWIEFIEPITNTSPVFYRVVTP